MSEISSLLLPSRIDGNGSLEQICVYCLLALTVSSTIVCIVFGLKYHAEHLIMGIVVALTGIHFFQLLRMYWKDMLQERKIFIFSAVVLLAVNIAALSYCVEFGPNENAQLNGCAGHPASPGGNVAFYSPKPFTSSSSSSCMKFNGMYPNNYVCAAVAVTDSHNAYSSQLAIDSNTDIQRVIEPFLTNCRRYMPNGTRLPLPSAWTCLPSCTPCLKRK